MPHNATALPETGHLFTTVNGCPLEPQSLLRILRSVAATHPDPEDTARPAAGSSDDGSSAGGTRA
ncbi:hypothetical protein M8Z33_32380 [Streptomyces sp. ZAF1911]|uniref:hypothetical protein n=1 Tax=Streptomyces sp. ZAF1911 TaxID=2944129 RepID=UPI00237BC987|nr:hypothetical protein [Streptomyces sp. ZAF1911]MDD9381267.1 hypothetical protein [Streptomyces sp. ZAF1911]